MLEQPKVALVTGANRGIGFETCRQLGGLGVRVILTARDPAKGRAAADKLRGEGLDIVFQLLDVTDHDRIRQLAKHIENAFGRLDALVNNAGILPDPQVGSSGLDADLARVRAAMETNVYGPLLLAQAFIPLMTGQRYGRIVNVSSGMGQLSDMNGGYPAYRLSKVALNAVTRILAAELADTNVKVNSVCPGWVRTGMGGPTAPRTPAEGADTIVWLATLPDDGPSGGFFRDRQPIPW
jgi:NAD(P)-dependent dehydrogenase (short-subunit alcohol dehydrogenase family)